MPLPFSFVVKYRSKIRCRCSGLIPTPVSVNDDRTRRPRAAVALDSQRAAVRHRLAGVEREVEKRLAQHRRVAVDVRHAVALDDERDAGALRLGLHDRDDLVEQRRQRHRLQFEILGSRELQEPLHHFVEPPDLVRDHLDVLQRLAMAGDSRRRPRARRCPPRPRRRGRRRRLRPAAAAARGGSSSRSADSSPRARRRPTAGRARPACASSARVDCTWLKYSRLRAISMMPTRSPVGSLIACVITSRSPLSPNAADSGPTRLAADERLLEQPPHRVIDGQPVGQRFAGRRARQQRAHRRVGEQQLAARVDDRDGVLEVLDGRFEVRHLPGDLRSVRRQLLADRVEEGAELAELVVLIQVQPHAEFAACRAASGRFG